MKVLSGKEVAKFRSEKLKQRVQEFTSKKGRPPGLAVILVGEDPASQVYVRNKGKACERVGIKSFENKVPADIKQADLNELIESYNSNDEVDGILVQFPLPNHLSKEEVLATIDPKKDPDGLTYENLGLLWSGQKRVASCTPFGVMKILEYFEINPEGKKAVVVGRSNIVGKPMAQLLTDANATVTVCHSRTSDLRSYTSEADIVVVAAGKPRMVGKDDFKKDAIVIDVGIHRPEEGEFAGKLCGDVRFEELEGHVAAATPVPGGVGPMTIQMLLENTLTLADLN